MGKKIIIILSSVLVLAVFGIVFLGNTFSKGSISDSEEKVVSNVEERSIENDIPITWLDGEEITDNEEILNRYDKVDKSTLTYAVSKDPATKHLTGYYFYETENGIGANIKGSDPSPPINDERYVKVLLGYSFFYLTDPITREAALSKADLVLPENCQEVRSKSSDDYELVFYSSDKGNFIVFLEYERIFNEDKSFAGINKDRVQSILYFKSITN